jgi:hypothetical protein
VFIHGLTGGQTTTWTAEGASTSWLEWLLSKDIPEARISVFGYDADVVKLFGQTSQNQIGQHARNLLGDLADMRFDSDTVSDIGCVSVDVGALLTNGRWNSLLYSLHTALEGSSVKMYGFNSFHSKTDKTLIIVGAYSVKQF